MLADKLQEDFAKKRRLQFLLTILMSLCVGAVFYAVGIDLTDSFNIPDISQEKEIRNKALDTLSYSSSFVEILGIKFNYYHSIASKSWVGWAFAALGFMFSWLMWAVFAKRKEVGFFEGRTDYFRNNFYKERKRRKKFAERVDNQYRDFLKMHDHIPEAFFLLSSEERVLHMNRFATDMLSEWLDQSLNPKQFLGFKIQDVVPSYIESGMGMIIQGCLARRESSEKEVFIAPHDIWLHVRAFNAPDGVVVYLQDVTEKKNPDNFGKFGSTLLNKIGKDVPTAFAVLDLQWNYMMVSNYWEDCFNPAGSELLGKNHKLVLPKFPGKWPTIDAQLAKGHMVRGDENMYHLNGKEEWINWRIMPWKNEIGAVGGYIVYADIVTDQREAQDKVSQQSEREKQLAYHDILTGLPNRQLFYDRLNMALASAYRHLSKVSLMFLDLDGFKGINDNLGHDVGDMLLKEVSSRIQQVVRETDTVARLGGDEFTVILSSIRGDEDVKLVADKVIEAVNKPFKLAGHKVHVSTSIGISMYPADGSTTTELIKKADGAMYWSKEHGKNQATFHRQLDSGELDHIDPVEAGERGALSPENQESFGGKAQPKTKPSSEVGLSAQDHPLYKDLKNALSNDEFILYYQPIFNIQSNTVVGAESLLRWKHPKRGMLTPRDFLELAVESGEILSIGNWVLDKTCAKAKEWKDAGHTGIRFCVNLTEVQLLDPQLLKMIMTTVEKYDIRAQELGFEVSESILSSGGDQVKKVLSALHDLGCKIIIDDYGLSYSPLKELQIFGVDMIKIHRSFLRNIGRSEEDQTLINSIIDISKNMKIMVIGEGVEEDAQADFLKEAGCSYAQGFLFGRPMHPADANEFFKQN